MSRVRSLLGSLIPFVEYDCSTSEGRHAFVENFQRRFGKLVSFLPFVMILAIACINMTAGIWSAFGTSTFVNLLGFYRSRYHEKKDKVMILDGSLWLSFLTQGIVYEAVKDRDTFPCHLIAPVNNSVLLAVAVLSLMFCYPFTMQIAKERVSDDVAKSQGFFKLNQMITLMWVGIFLTMTVCSWVSYFIFGDDTSGVGHLILSTVVPITLPILGMLLSRWIVSSAMKRQTGHHDNDEDDDERTSLLGSDNKGV